MTDRGAGLSAAEYDELIAAHQAVIDTMDRAVEEMGKHRDALQEKLSQLLLQEGLDDAE